MEVGKRKHKYVAGVLLSLYAGILLITGLIYWNPGSADRLLRAFFEPSIHISPSKNGFAKINHQVEPSEDGSLGAALEAGDRFQSQMNFISAVD